jgi:superfamily II DNA or RNA helicase
MNYKTGTLVRARGRDWVVLPSEREDLMRLKPLDGRDEDIAGIFLPLAKTGDIRPSQFEAPTTHDLGSVRAARLLYDASRLSLRSAAGPFRCAAKLGFRPRSYQMVPLIMALKQKGAVRLLIADDVGVGKTVEAILIAKELLERREIKRFAVLCPPHLCDQWQEELRDKFRIDAVVIRTGTQAGLDRQVPGDMSVFQYFPYQVISIDYIKSDNRYSVFASQAPDLIIVDEAHSCAKPEGSHVNQQLRHRLVHELAKKKDRHLVLVTATPHSGKEGEFRSLLGLLKGEFEEGDWESESRDGDAQKAFRTELARHFIQRKRENIALWMGEHTPFPKRTAIDIPYGLAPAYQALYDEVLLFSSHLMSEHTGTDSQKRFRYWSALALLRGIMSSPRAGALMLENRAAQRRDKAEEADVLGAEAGKAEENPHYERLESTDDELPTPLLERIEWSGKDRATFASLAGRLRSLEGEANDRKLASCLFQIKQWLKAGYSPIVFCRYIETAAYVAEKIAAELGKGAIVECVTSIDPDEVRRKRIADMDPDLSGKKPKALVATDCLSEGINLQRLFTAVLHYDLPWNPNRLEQREGRVDRFGQTKDEIQTCLLYGQDNPMDQVVLKVLYRKARRIRDNIGVSIPFPEDSKVFLDTIFKAVLAEAEKKKKPVSQMELFALDEMVRSEEELDKLITVTERKEKALRSIFAQASIKAQDIEKDLGAMDEAVGRPETVFRFVDSAFRELFGLEAKTDADALEIDVKRSSFPEKLRSALEAVSGKDDARLAFHAPVRDERVYWGRNHEAVELLCRTVLSDSLDPDRRYGGAARAAVVLSGEVKERTVIYLLRARHVIEELRSKSHLVAEEVLLQGLSGPERRLIARKIVDALMESPGAIGDLPRATQEEQLERELSKIPELRAFFDRLAFERAEELIRQHERYYKALGSELKTERFKVVEPVIPMDVLGLYIFVPGSAS